MIETNKTVQSIFQLNSSVEHLFFKDFVRAYELPKGLNPTHIRTLLTLKHHGSCPMSTLSHLLNIEKGSFTPVANKLLKLGLIEKEQSESDRRVYNLSLTEEGLALATDFGSKHLAYINSLLAHLSTADEDRLVQYVNDILDLFSKIPGNEKIYHPKNPGCQ